MTTTTPTPVGGRGSIAQSGPYMVLHTPDGSASTVVHQPTGRTVWSSSEEGHREKAKADAKARNERGGA